MPTTVVHLSTLAEHVDHEVGVSEWLLVDQARIDKFADATDDHQWIHTDPERAARESPFGGTIAHGFLTVSLITTLFEDAVRVDGVRMGVNYGINAVRFMAPLPAGARVRGRFRLLELTEVRGGGYQATWGVRVEREEFPKPCCTAECVVRLYPAEA
jgi:acyl dehydratase